MSNVVVRRKCFRIRSITKWLILITVIILSPGCGSVEPVVKIGLVGPFEGRHRDVGYDVIYSARLAVREINDSGGINGYRLALVALDDFGDPEIAQETAEALVLDPGVVVVIGHWLLETTESVDAIYDEAGLAFVATGREPFDAYDPDRLPAEFWAAYEAVTPFDEVPGPLAAASYDAMGLVIDAMRQAAETNGTITRENLIDSLRGLNYEGLTGQVSAPNMIE